MYKKTYMKGKENIVIIIIVAFCNYREYSSESVCVSVFLCFRVFGDNSKSNQSMNTKFLYSVTYENILEKFDIGHRWTKVKVTA